MRSRNKFLKKDKTGRTRLAIRLYNSAVFMAKTKSIQPLSLFGETFTKEKSQIGKASQSPKKRKKNSSPKIHEKPEREKSTAEKTQHNFESTQHLLERYQVVPVNKAISHEFQSFGCYLAETLGDLAHTSLYIRLAKRQSRAVLEQALRFVVDSQARNKAKLFMWKLQQLKLQQQQPPQTLPHQNDQKSPKLKGEA